MYICAKVANMDNSIFNIFDRCRDKFPIFQVMENGEDYTFKRKDFYSGGLSFSASLADECVTITSRTANGTKFKMVLHLNADTGHTFLIFDKDLIMAMTDDFCLELLKLNITLLNTEYDVVRILRLANLKDILNEQQ